MRINMNEFNRFASEQGFSDGEDLLINIGFTSEESKQLMEDLIIDRGTLLRFYEEFGTCDVLDFVEFDSDYEWERNLDLFDEV